MDDILQQIEDYLTGKLTPEETIIFEEKLKSDTDLAQEVEVFRDLIGGIRLKSNKQLKGHLDTLFKEAENQSETGARIRTIRFGEVRKWGALAAGLLLLLTFFFLMQKDDSPSQIFAQHYHPYELNISTRGSDGEDKLQKAGQEYEKGAYAAALSGFREYLASNPMDAEVALGAGIASLETGQLNEALSFLEVSEKNELFREQAYWYKALIYLKMNEPEKAKEMLNQIIQDPQSAYFKEAKNVLKKL